MKIIVSGSLAYDRIMDFPDYFKNHILPNKIHKLSVSFQINGIRENFGGTAGNIAYNLKLLKENPLIVGTIGKDNKNYFKKWRKNKIDTSKIKIIEKVDTATAYIMTDKDDNQIAGFYPGSMAYHNCLSERELKKYVGQGLAIVSPENKEGMLEKMALYKKFNLPYIFDPGQQLLLFSRSELIWAIRQARIVVGNDYEHELIIKKTGLALSQLIRLAGIFVITLGAKGSIIKIKDKSIKIKAIKPGKVVDPTGAGDAFRAGFIKGYIHNLSLSDCGRIGSLAAAYPIEYYGTQEHFYAYPEFKNSYRKIYKKDLNI